MNAFRSQLVFPVFCPFGLAYTLMGQARMAEKRSTGPHLMMIASDDGINLPGGMVRTPTK